MVALYSSSKKELLVKGCRKTSHTLLHTTVSHQRLGRGEAVSLSANGPLKSQPAVQPPEMREMA